MTPGRGQLLAVGSTGAKKASGGSHVELRLGIWVPPRLASLGRAFRAHCGAVDVDRQKGARMRKQVSDAGTLVLPLVLSSGSRVEGFAHWSGSHLFGVMTSPCPPGTLAE